MFHTVTRIVPTCGLLAAMAIGLTACENGQSTESGVNATERATTQASMGVINTTCPFTGEPVNAAVETVEHEGYKVGFCCEGCAGRWSDWSEEQKDAYLQTSLSGNMGAVSSKNQGEGKGGQALPCCP